MQDALYGAVLPVQLVNRDLLRLEQVHPEQKYLGISADFVKALLSMQAVLALVPVTRFGEHYLNLRAIVSSVLAPLSFRSVSKAVFHLLMF